MKFNDELFTNEEWHALLDGLITEELISWKDVTTLIFGQMNPSQVGTSLASSPGFKRRYGKGEVMQKVMEWFYEQDGRCHDCGSRLELQADHIKPREEYKDPLDADFIENMTLRCRRCNVIRRQSHRFGGQTHLTAESALMWILFSFRPRTITDYVRMCRLYGMTMADVRMQEGWAMAHWLRKPVTDRYVIDSDDKTCQLLLWPDGGITRCWTNDEVPDKDTARILFDNALPPQHLVVLASLASEDGATTRIQAIRYRVGNIPFSHYSPEDGAESLAINYTPPKRKKGEVAAAEVEIGEEGAAEEALAVEELAEEGEETVTEEIIALPEGAKISLMPPRGMTFLNAKLAQAGSNVTVTWTLNGRAKEAVILAKSRGKLLCTVKAADLPLPAFTLT